MYVDGVMKCIHFIGIGGVGMSALAEFALRLGINVQGSEVFLNEYTYRLRALGIKIFNQYDILNVLEVDAVVVSSAVDCDNVEVKAAVRHGIPILPRARLLAEVNKNCRNIIISGAHRKTTTSGLIAVLLESNKYDPTMFIGGKLIDFESNIKCGHGKYSVIEADESDGSLLLFEPYMIVFTNFDLEHVDYWRGGVKECCNAFYHFFNSISFCGTSIICSDSFILMAFVNSLKGRVITYGLCREADYSISSIVFKGGFTYFKLVKYGKLLGEFRSRLLGVHNIQNALGMICVADELKISVMNVNSVLETYAGINRRLTYIGEINNILILDDYAHHPTEMMVILNTIKRLFYNRRIIVLFEPHRTTRFYHLLNEFLDVFLYVDVLFLCNVYLSEDRTNEVNLIDLVKKNSKLEYVYVGTVENATNKLIDVVRSGDIILTLGAGDITKWAWYMFYKISN